MHATITPRAQAYTTLVIFADLYCNPKKELLLGAFINYLDMIRVEGMVSKSPNSYMSIHTL